MFGWKPQIPFDLGIAETVSWYCEQPDWLTSVLERQDTFLAKALVLAGQV